MKAQRLTVIIGYRENAETLSFGCIVRGDGHHIEKELEIHNQLWGHAHRDLLSFRAAKNPKGEPVAMCYPMGRPKTIQSFKSAGIHFQAWSLVTAFAMIHGRNPRYGFEYYREHPEMLIRVMKEVYGLRIERLVKSKIR